MQLLWPCSSTCQGSRYCPLVAGELSRQELAEEKLYGQYGGPFTLIDHEGKTVTNTNFHGRYLLVFFGYTYCPDVCPTAMQTVSETMDFLGDYGVKYFKVFTPPSFNDTQGENEDNSYSISHSAATYLMGTDGKFITYFAYETPPEEMAKEIRRALK